MSPPATQKVFAYLTRGDRRELLVFWDRTGEDAGPQLPGGTVDPGEPLLEAILREVAEESGMFLRQSPSYLGMDAVRVDGELHHRHYFHLEVGAEAADAWRHCVTAGEEDEGRLFEFRWLRVDHAMADLLDRQQALLGLVAVPSAAEILETVEGAV